MPKLVSFYIRNILIGFAAAVVFVGLLLGLNIANLRHLIMGSDMGLVAVVMLIVFNTIVFGAALDGQTISLTRFTNCLDTGQAAGATCLPLASWPGYVSQFGPSAFFISALRLITWKFGMRVPPAVP